MSNVKVVINKIVEIKIIINETKVIVYFEGSIPNLTEATPGGDTFYLFESYFVVTKDKCSKDKLDDFLLAPSIIKTMVILLMKTYSPVSTKTLFMNHDLQNDKLSMRVDIYLLRNRLFYPDPIPS